MYLRLSRNVSHTSPLKKPLTTAKPPVHSLNKKPVLYVNVAEKITKHCDCVSEPAKLVAEDSGIYVSEDPVAIDTASFKDVEKNLTKTKNLKEVNDVDPWLHLKTAEKFGVGKTSYTIKTI